jgi:acetyl-CoA C-acetyltransferase
MKAVMLGHDLIKAGSATVVVAGGMESMTYAPHMIPNSRTGNRYGNFEAVDHMAWDGLTNPYDGKAMGVFGESCADKYHFTREQQDAFATESVKRAQAAIASGAFKDEIVPVTVKGRKGDTVVDTDEQPGKSDIAKIPTLKPAFRKENGTITAASSSSISDGAAATVLMSADEAKKRNVKPIARIVAHATHSQEPEWFTTAPIGAIQNVLKKAGWKVDEVDLFEVNEAFAVVAMAPMKELGIPHEKLNVHGGATALGHPIGASGARLIVTLIHALKQKGGKRGVASLCIGGGAATAVAIVLASLARLHRRQRAATTRGEIDRWTSSTSHFARCCSPASPRAATTRSSRRRTPRTKPPRRRRMPRTRLRTPRRKRPTRRRTRRSRRPTR